MARIVVTVAGTTVVVRDGDKVVINIPGGGDVTIVADPNDNVDNIKIEFLGDSEADTVNIDLSTFSENDLHIDIKGYDPTDTINLLGAFNRYVDPNEVDEYTFDYIGLWGETFSAFVHAKDGQERDFTAPNPPIIICFGEGTLIETINGPKAIETLSAGERVKTLDSEYMPIRWIGKTKLDWFKLAKSPQLRPIVIRKNAFGAGTPAVDLVLSPNHRVLVSDWRAQVYFGEEEVLVPVKSLVDGVDIFVDQEVSSVTYYHLLLDEHEVVWSNGLPSESLLLGSQAFCALSDQSMTEILKEIRVNNAADIPVMEIARKSIRHNDALVLAA